MFLQVIRRIEEMKSNNEPALLIRISTPPNFSFATETTFCQSASLVTLAVTVWTCVSGWSPKLFARPSSFISAATTFAPSATNRWVMALPKPEAAPFQMLVECVVEAWSWPVTIATLPDNRPEPVCTLWRDILGKCVLKLVEVVHCQRWSWWMVEV